ncbi:MAG: hypothetical protein IPK82_24310 [Polyangiaceae bacterium]|nr:hypothetical protein [Polyangiaceae bacterium]
MTILNPKKNHSKLGAAGLCTGIAALSFSAAALGCGAAQTAGAGNFPTQDELLKLKSVPPPTHALDRGAVDVDTFTLSGPLPDVIEAEPIDPQTPWQKLLVEQVVNARAQNTKSVIASGAMDCLARQVAAFAAEKGALPTQSFVRFASARCGALTGIASTGFRGAEVADKSTEEELYKEWSADVAKDLRALMGDGMRELGVAFVRKEKKAIVAYVSAPRSVILERVPMVPKDGVVVLKGKLVNPAASVRALVTRGQFGFEVCIKDIEATLPNFSIECPVNADDPGARVEIAAFEEGRELGASVLDIQLAPNGKPQDVYTRVAKDDKAPSDIATLRTALLDRVNQVRKEAGMGALTLAQTQSQTATELAPYFFASGAGNLEPRVADRVALGMLAGWDVGVPVREGHFASQWVTQRSVAGLVEAAIGRPYGRETLLDPGASLLAVGPLLEEDNLAAVLSTYATIDASGKTDYAGQVLARLTKLRGKVKRAAPEVASVLDPVMSDAVARVEAGEDLKEVLDRMTNKAAEASPGSRVASWFVTTSSVERLEYPSPVLARSTLRLAVGVARYKPEGSPWTKLAVLFVALEETAAPNTAQRQASPAL